MRKQYKEKKKACGLCKPFKRGWEKRWKYKEAISIKEFEKEKNENRNSNKE